MPYSYVINNPLKYTDPSGNEISGGSSINLRNAAWDAGWINHSYTIESWNSFLNNDWQDFIHEGLGAGGGGGAIVQVNMGEGDGEGDKVYLANLKEAVVTINRTTGAQSVGWVGTGKDITFGGGLFASVWGTGFEAGANYTPKYAQRGVTKASLTAEALQFSKYARYAARAGNILTGADALLSFAEYGYSDKSWGDKTKLGVNLGIAGLGLVRHPAAQGLSIGLGIAETAGAFNGLYKYADDSQQTGILIIPSGIFISTTFIFRIR